MNSIKEIDEQFNFAYRNLKSDHRNGHITTEEYQNKVKAIRYEYEQKLNNFDLENEVNDA